MKFFSTLKIIGIQTVYTILFSWQCTKLMVYGTFNLTITIIYLFGLQTIQAWKTMSLFKAILKYLKKDIDLT